MIPFWNHVAGRHGNQNRPSVVRPADKILFVIRGHSKKAQPSFATGAPSCLILRPYGHVDTVGYLCTQRHNPVWSNRQTKLSEIPDADARWAPVSLKLVDLRNPSQAASFIFNQFTGLGVFFRDPSQSPKYYSVCAERTTFVTIFHATKFP